jgi:hypothetical protein
VKPLKLVPITDKPKYSVPVFQKCIHFRVQFALRTSVGICTCNGVHFITESPCTCP